MSLEACHPALGIFDVVLATSFYLQWLRFQLDWEHRPENGGPSIMEVSRDLAVLHLTEHYGADHRVHVFIGIDDLEELHQEISERPNHNMRPGIETAAWREEFMSVIDPFGNRLALIQQSS
ncbi:glyoxalase superfamily protein [Occallatibacter riparius]|uniref:Bleomycin resistance protein n=1 Tax=Occallatibacter riparius TaxID=1002689 RepID=A0A9J7BJW8_9BACT|nr:glyoxalase superfamily protein [Occallatibacter riparius]UWZ82843.1 glyoxalase superfamily protein [Occallatibacter riparius]